MKRPALVSVLAVLAAGQGAGAAEATPSVRLKAVSHYVERVLPRDAARPLPVHEGGTVAIAASDPITRLAVRARGSIRARQASRSGKRWLFEVSGDVPRRVILTGERDGRRFRLGLWLRDHEHRTIETAPGRLIDGREVFWIEWVFRPESLRELFSPAPESFPVRPTVEGGAVAEVVGTEPARITDDHPGYEVPAQHVSLRTQRRWFGEVPRRFKLLKTGNDEIWAAADPPYKQGEVYVLFMERRADDVFIPVAPEGRYLVQRRTLWPVIAGRLGRIFSALTVEEAHAVTKRAREGRR